MYKATLKSNIIAHPYNIFQSAVRTPGLVPDHYQYNTQQQRKLMVEKACQKHHGNMPEVVRRDIYPHSRILVDEDHKDAYCGIPNVNGHIVNICY